MKTDKWNAKAIYKIAIKTKEKIVWKRLIACFASINLDNIPT